MQKLINILLIILFLGIQSYGQDSFTEIRKDTVDTPIVQKPVKETHAAGTVEVSFRIDEKGEVEIVNINSNNPELIDYVIKKLQKIKLDPSYKGIGKTIKYRFQFKKQA